MVVPISAPILILDRDNHLSNGPSIRFQKVSSLETQENAKIGAAKQLSIQAETESCVIVVTGRNELIAVERVKEDRPTKQNPSSTWNIQRSRKCIISNTDNHFLKKVYHTLYEHTGCIQYGANKSDSHI